MRNARPYCSLLRKIWQIYSVRSGLKIKIVLISLRIVYKMVKIYKGTII